MSDHEGSPVTSLLMESDYMASGDEAGNVNIGKIFTDEQFHVKIHPIGPVTALLFSTDGASLFTVSTNHVVSEWRTDNGEKVREFVGEVGNSITSIA